MNTSTHKKTSSSSSLSVDRSLRLSQQDRNLFDATVRYGVRIAQLEAAFELLARGMVRDLRTAVLAAYDLNSFLLGSDYQRFSAVISGVVYQQITGYWPRLWPILEDGHNRAAAMATRYISAALMPRREDAFDDAQTEVEEMEQRLEDLTGIALMIQLLSAAQSRRRAAIVIVNGLTIDQFWEQLARNQSQRFQTVINAVGADAQATGSFGEVRSVVANMLSDVPQGASRAARFSGQSDTSVLSSLKKWLSSIVHGIGNDSLQAVSEFNDEMFAGEVHTAILDDATCPVCRSLNGTYYPFDEGRSTARTLPIHFMCRCKLSPVSEPPGEESGPGNFGEWFSEQSPEFRGSVFHSSVSGARTFPDARKRARIYALTYPSLRESKWMSQ